MKDRSFEGVVTEELVPHAVLDRHGPAMCELLHRTQGEIRTTSSCFAARFHVRSTHAACDLEQEAVVEVLESIHRFVPRGRSSYRRWTKSVTWRTGRGVWRRGSAARRNPQPGSRVVSGNEPVLEQARAWGWSPTESLHGVDVLRRKFPDLGEREARIFVLHDDGMSFQAIASLMHLPVADVEDVYSRTLSRLIARVSRGTAP